MKVSYSMEFIHLLSDELMVESPTPTLKLNYVIASNIA